MNRPNRSLPIFRSTFNHEQERKQERKTKIYDTIFYI